MKWQNKKWRFTYIKRDEIRCCLRGFKIEESNRVDY